MRIIGNPAGQFGDLVISTVLAQTIKTIHPNCEYTFALSQKYSAIAFLFEKHPFIDKIHIWDTFYEPWPNEVDQKFLMEEKYDHILPTFPQHKDEWYKHRHIAQEILNMYGFNFEDVPYKVILNKEALDREKRPRCVAMSVFGSYGREVNKSLSPEKANQIAKHLFELGYTVYHLGGEGEPTIHYAQKTGKDFKDSVQIMESCDFLITVDTAMSWIASGYDQPVLGLYSDPYGYNCQKNLQPLNPNAIYLNAKTCDEISWQSIIQGINYLSGKYSNKI